MATDLKNFERRIDNQIDEVINGIADDVLNDMGIKEEDDPKYVKYYEVYEDIQKYLIEKFNKEIHNRFINRKLKEAEEKTRKRIEKEPDFGRIGFTMTEQQTRIVQVLQELGYQTEACYDEGYEWVEYWKEGKRPKPDNGV